MATTRPFERISVQQHCPGIPVLQISRCVPAALDYIQLLRDPVRAVSSKCVDRPGSSQNFTPMQHTPRDGEFLPGLHWNPPPIDDEGVAALHHSEVLVGPQRSRAPGSPQTRPPEKLRALPLPEGSIRRRRVPGRRVARATCEGIERAKPDLRNHWNGRAPPQDHSRRPLRLLRRLWHHRQLVGRRFPSEPFRIPAREPTPAYLRVRRVRG